MSGPVARRSRRGWAIALLLVLLVAGLAGPHAYGWYHLRAAETALKRADPDAARQELAACKRVWGHRQNVLLLSSRAARQTDDFEVAEKDLRAAHRRAGGPDPDVAFEWALYQAAAGNVWEVDEFLQEKAGDSPERAALIWEALISGYLRVFRTLDAMRVAEYWLAGDPDNVRALELRGNTFVTGKGVQRGTEDFRRVLELAPDRDRTRRRLVDCLMDLGGFDEAVPHIERLGGASDPGLATHLARCYNVLGRPADARRILDETLAAHPDHARALRTRGQFALADDQRAAAESFLKRAVAAAPNDYQSHFLLSQALQLQGKQEEAKAQIAVADAVKDRVERLSELRSRKLAEFPLDPALHTEMGSLLLRGGDETMGERWLGSALSLDPNFAAAHAALAVFYERRGDAARAAEHRRRVGK